MSERFPGGIISKTAPVPTGPYENGTAPGVWTLDQQAAFVKQGIWPLAGNSPNYIEDVFSTWLYTGNGSTQTITNGVDLAGKGGLVWGKERPAPSNHYLVDTVRGVGNNLKSNTTDAQQAIGLNSFTSTGFTTGSFLNDTGSPYVSWTFRKQPKFFTCGTYTGNGSANRVITHDLGSAPGCIIVKNITYSGASWNVYHRSLSADQVIYLNSTSAAGGTTGIRDVTSTSFTLGASDEEQNYSGQQFVYYAFAHNAGGFGLTGTDNVISCGSFTTDGSGNATVSLGYEPQWVLYKHTAIATDWNIFDNMRGMPVGSQGLQLKPNSTAADNQTTGYYPTSTGFQAVGLAASQPQIYIAIRRGPMKVPTTGTSVFSPALGTSASTIPTFVTNFPVDLGFYHSKANVADWFLSSRLQGGGTLNTNTTFAEGAPDANYAFDSNTGWGKNFNSDKISFSFKRAPGFFDEVCYTGSSAARTLNHNLAAVPELMIVKDRTNTNNWVVYTSTTGNNYALILNSTAAVSGPDSGDWNATTPTASVFSVGGNGRVNASGANYVAYLFATCPGVSKVGSYTGTGALQTVNCGFTAGARFVLIKRTDSTGDWYVYDSARGITSGNDPYLFLNTTAAEVTGTNYVDTTGVGFQVTAAAPAGLNASGGTFIFLAIS
jgi:hypothetical protein